MTTMPASIGSAAASFRLGATTPAAVYLGSVEVWSAGPTVPGPPAIDSVDANFSSELLTVLYSPPASDGGSEITGYKFYGNGEEIVPDNATTGVSAQWLNIYNVQHPLEIVAVNAVGEGPRVTITF